MSKEKEGITQEEKEEIGRATWTLLHSISKFYPNHPTERQKEAVGLLFKSLHILYPCRSCAPAFIVAAETADPSNRLALSTSLCLFHNFVNRQLNKPEVPCVHVKHTSAHFVLPFAESITQKVRAFSLYCKKLLLS